nr:MAG TPA: hypothetical protein [Inoviridae sp.]
MHFCVCQIATPSFSFKFQRARILACSNLPCIAPKFN